MITAPVDELLFGGARGGAKTSGMIGKWIHHSRYEAGRYARGILFRRSYDELEDILEQCREFLPEEGAEYRAGKRTWYMRNGSTLKLRFLARDQDASRYMGHNYTMIGIDEAGNFPKPDPIMKLKATLRSRAPVRKYLLLTANPGGVGSYWLKERYVDPVPPMTPYQDPETQEWRLYIPSRVEDNPHISNPDRYRNAIKGSGPPWLVAAWLNGDWNASPDGGIIKADWLRYYTERPINLLRIIQSWDTASKASEVHSYSVCTTWAQYLTPAGVVDVLLNVWRGRLPYPELKARVVALFSEYTPNVVLIEDKGHGTALLQDLPQIPTHGIMPVKDKIMRICAESQRFESGMVWLPKWAPWLNDYVLELTGCPAVEHMDQVDSTSQALMYLRETSARIEIVTGVSSRYSQGAYNG